MLANTIWMDAWPSSSYVSALPSTSDHSPLILTGMDRGEEHVVFRFDNYLAHLPGFLNLVEEIWKHRIAGTAMYETVCKLKLLKAVFRQQKRLKGDLTENVRQAKNFLDKAQALFTTYKEDIFLDLVKSCRRVYSVAVKLEISMLQQRAKLRWLKHGDQSSKIFFRKINTNRVKQRVFQITKVDGVLLTAQHDVNQEFISYFQNLFGGPSLHRRIDLEFLRHELKHTITTAEARLLVAPAMFQAVGEFFRTGKMLKQINTTLISLIPKVSLPRYVSDYRPIACCNVLYKSITKIIVKRLQQVLPLLIDYSQNAFVPGRSITDNILLAQELLAASFSVSLNGSIHGFFKGGRGLRQGDPMSPYLFVLVMEIWNLLLKFRTKEAPISSTTGRLKVNPTKSQIFFSRAVQQERQQILDYLGFQEGSLPVRYLGIPLTSSRLTIADCRPLIDKVDARLAGWNNQILSYAGRLQLIKSVLTTLHTFWASAFILPKGVLKTLEKKMRQFLWQGSAGSGNAKDAWHEPVATGLPLSSPLSSLIQRHQWCWPASTDPDFIGITSHLPPLHSSAADCISWRSSSDSEEGYVGLPAALGIRARLPFPAGARRNVGSACEREEGCETVSRGDEPHTIDMDTHIDNSIGNVDQLLHVASTLSLPKITSSSVDNLVQYSTIPESAIVENTVPPVISPYNLYRKKGSLPQGIRALIASKKHMNQKEQVHSSKMDHCSLPASTKEQYVTLSIPPDYISGWKAEGYTHLHLGAVRLVLSYHGRKGLPVTARIALLDTRFLEYEHAVIGTVLTTLNAGSIVVTFFPNFAVSLSDPHVASAFKVQVQITGANQVPASVMATLHHQLVFRLQNHSLDLPNQGSRDAPMVLANSGTEIPTIIQIPRQIQRKDLEKLVPTEWITNYESLQQQHETVKSTDFRFKRLPDGRVKTIFKTQPDGEPSNPEFQLMITPIPVPKKIVTPVASFGADGHRIYTDRINGHFIWDVNPSMCDPECSCEEDDDDSSDDEDNDWSDYESDEDDDLSSCHDSDDDYDEPDPDERQAFRKPQSCMMFQYETDFPPMERYVDSAQKYSSKPYVQNNVVDTEGKLKPLTQAEEVLNWQTTNARAQNRSLTTLDAKMDRVLSRVQTTESKVEGMENQLQKIYDNLVQRIQQLDRDLRFLIDQRDFGMEFNQKEAEIRRLKKELAQMEQDRYKVTKPLPIYSPFTSQPLFTTQPLFGESPPSSPPDYSKYFFMASDIPTDLPKAPPKHTLTKPIYPYEKEDEDTECASLEDSDIISEESKDSETNLADITSILMADAESSRQPQEQVAENIEGEESDSDPETAEPTVLQPDISNTKPVLVHGSLLMMSRLSKDEKGSTPFQHGLIFNLQGKVQHSLRYLKNLLRFTEKFYMLNGLNDPNLKHVFLASLPQELQPEIQRMITSTRRDVTQLSLGFNGQEGDIKESLQQVSSGNPMQENVYLPIQITTYQKKRQDKEEISEVLQTTTIQEKED
ncbi:UNVERIFIED_CONTAM: polyprotein [Sesamum radiatum]|uniref:Polyprotein n=1 Tax=Sesamum radiatum TaxID=300843 RepID=A0AAW2I7H9_SESRA